MKLVLASYFQPENHGPGRKIGVSPGKPKESPTECDVVFQSFVPEGYWDYHKAKKTDPKEAGVKFVTSYEDQLSKFVESVNEEAKKEGKSPLEILPFKDGDTLLSWENKGNMSYRGILARFLRDLGYEVEES